MTFNKSFDKTSTSAVLVFVTVLSIIFTYVPALTDKGIYSRVEIQHYQVWRLFTSTFVHINLEHLLLNLSALTLLSLFTTTTFSNTRFIKDFFACSLFIGAILFLTRPDIVWYCGLSGVFHGLFLIFCLQKLSRPKITDWTVSRTTIFVLAITIVAKVVLEQLTETKTSVFVTQSFPVLTDAHLYGVLYAMLSMLPSLFQYITGYNND